MTLTSNVIISIIIALSALLRGAAPFAQNLSASMILAHSEGLDIYKYPLCVPILLYVYFEYCGRHSGAQFYRDFIYLGIQNFMLVLLCWQICGELMANVHRDEGHIENMSLSVCFWTFVHHQMQVILKAFRY